ncbi:MAG: hypothetical protein F4X20_08140 [Dehalococcoidia bacterium]|nr:hypothetical protein [Dehalococcoidia bacterium]
MQNTASCLNDVHRQLAPSNETLAAARARRDEVLAAAREYGGVLRTYISGSIAHKTANHDTDADCGIVLDRRSYPALGPDGDGEGPGQVVEEVRRLVRGDLKEGHPGIAFRVTKRAIQIKFNEPLPDGSDPSVDLIVALTRKGEGLWIPNTEMDRWDASHPEYHTEILTADPAELRRTRAKIIRLAKGWNSQFTKPGLCSFNIEALALACITEEHGVPDGLAELFRFAASELKNHLTPDPADVSGPIKLLHDRDIVVGRLERAASLMEEALENDADRNKVEEAIGQLYPNYAEDWSATDRKSLLAAALRADMSPFGISVGPAILTPQTTTPSKSTRSYGSEPSAEV